MVTPAPNTRVAELSWRKLVLRAIAEPVIAPAKWPNKVAETRGSNSTGYFPGLGRAAPTRATARSPARRPMSTGLSRSRDSGAVPGMVALHGRALARDHAGRAAVAVDP